MRSKLQLTVTHNGESDGLFTHVSCPRRMSSSGLRHNHQLKDAYLVKTETTSKRSSTQIFVVASALAAAVAAAGAQADTITISNYTPIFQGISEATATVNGESAAVLQINLDAPGISFTTSPLCSGCTAASGANVVTKQTASQFLVSRGTAVVIDANQYTNNKRRRGTL